MHLNQMSYFFLLSVRKFQDLSSVLPPPSERNEEDKAGWRVFTEFNTFMRSLGSKNNNASTYDDQDFETPHV